MKMRPSGENSTGRIAAELALVYAAAIWGSTFFIVKDTLAYIDPVVLVGYRFILAGLAIAGYLIVKRVPLWHGWRHGLFLGVVLWALYLPQTIGLGITTASNSGFITGLFIVFVPVVNWLWLKRRPLPRHLAAVGLALIGLWLLTGGIRGANAGDIMTLAAAVTYAVHVLYAGRCMERSINPWVLNCQQMLVVGVLALATALVHGTATGSVIPHFAILHVNGVYALLFLTLFPTITAYAAQLYGQRTVNPLRTSLIFTLEPVFAALFAWTLGSEQLVTLRALGGFLMVLAMVVSEVEYGRAPVLTAAKWETSEKDSSSKR